MTAARDLTGLVGPGQGAVPERTVTAPPPRRRSAGLDTPAPDPTTPGPTTRAEPRPRATRKQGRQPGSEVTGTTRRNETSNLHRPTTERISVNVPLACKQWLTRQARDQQRFVSDVLMEALDRHGEEASPLRGRAKRVAVPDGSICSIVLPAQDKRRLDDAVARKGTTRSSLVSEVLHRAASASVAVTTPGTPSEP